MTKLTLQEIEQERENKQCTFESLLLSTLYKRKNFSLATFNSLMVKNEKGNYMNNCIENDFKAWLARAELAKGEL